MGLEQMGVINLIFFKKQNVDKNKLNKPKVSSSNLKELISDTRIYRDKSLKSYRDCIKMGNLKMASMVHKKNIYYCQVEDNLKISKRFKEERTKERKYNKERVKKNNEKTLKLNNKLKNNEKKIRTLNKKLKNAEIKHIDEIKQIKSSAKKKEQMIQKQLKDEFKINEKRLKDRITSQYYKKLDKEIESIQQRTLKDTIVINWDSYILENVKNYVNSAPPEEKIGYIAGFKDKQFNFYTPTGIFDLELLVSTPVGATPEPSSISETLNELGNSGHVLNAIVHRHYGYGPGATYPSSVDMGTLQSLEACYPAVSIIFSEDNYFRIVHGKKKIENRFYGNSLKRVGDRDEEVFSFN
jgi:hypothetical protein